MSITDGMYQLGHAARKLNRGSDELNLVLTQIDETLGRLGIGMDYTLERPLIEDVNVGPDQKRVIELGYLAYGRHKGRFRLLYKTLKVLEARRDLSRQSPGSVIPLLEAPRRIRHRAIDQLPELVGGLANSVDDVLNQLERRKEVAANVLSQLQQMLYDGESPSRPAAPSSRPAVPGSHPAVASRPADSAERPRRRTAPGHLGQG